MPEADLPSSARPAAAVTNVAPGAEKPAESSVRLAALERAMSAIQERLDRLASLLVPPGTDKKQ